MLIDSSSMFNMLTTCSTQARLARIANISDLVEHCSRPFQSTYATPFIIIAFTKDQAWSAQRCRSDPSQTVIRLWSCNQEPICRSCDSVTSTFKFARIHVVVGRIRWHGCRFDNAVMSWLKTIKCSSSLWTSGTSGHIALVEVRGGVQCTLNITYSKLKHWGNIYIYIY